MEFIVWNQILIPLQSINLPDNFQFVTSLAIAITFKLKAMDLYIAIFIIKVITTRDFVLDSLLN